MQKIRTTRKKVKVIGKQEYVNTATGEVEVFNVIQETEKDANFHKIWLGHIIQALEAVGNQKIKVVNFIMDNLNKENQLVMTQRKIAEKANVSLPVVAETIKILTEADFLSQVQSGVYRINPEVIFKGGTSERMNILIQYQSEKASKAEEPQEEPQKEEKQTARRKEGKSA